MTETYDTTRTELEASHVAAGIAKWGESERSGLERQARAKTTETLLVDYAIRRATTTGATEAEIMTMPEVTAHCTSISAADLGGLVGFGCLDE